MACLRDATLVSSDLQGADLTLADLTGADLRGSVFLEANMHWTDFSGPEFDDGV